MEKKEDIVLVVVQKHSFLLLVFFICGQYTKNGPIVPAFSLKLHFLF